METAGDGTATWQERKQKAVEQVEQEEEEECQSCSKEVSALQSVSATAMCGCRQLMGRQAGHQRRKGEMRRVGQRGTSISATGWQSGSARLRQQTLRQSASWLEGR